MYLTNPYRTVGILTNILPNILCESDYWNFDDACYQDKKRKSMEWIFSGISCNYGRSHKYVYTHTFVLGKKFYAEGKVSRVMHDAYF